MKLNPIQGLWLVAVALYAGSLLLDVANVLSLPSSYILVGNTFLLLSGWWVMPSRKAMQEVRWRRSSRSVLRSRLAVGPPGS